MPSRRSLELSPFLAMEVMEEAGRQERAGEDIIHFELGEPDLDTPQCIKEAAYRALRDGKTHYTDSRGLLELREAISEHYWEKYRVKVSPDQVLVTAGTSPALWILFSTLLEPGDQVVLSNPYYPCYPNFVRFFNGVPVFVDLSASGGYQLRPKAVAEKLNPKTKGILINSPANPTGAVLSGEIIAAIADLGPLTISDEIYHGLVYEGNEHTVLEYTDRAFVLNGFSKLYAMTGWRLGWVIAPPEYIRPMQVVHQNFFLSANAFVQWAGVAALREAREDVAVMRDTYNARRRAILMGLREIGLAIPWEPTGAFYVLADARKHSQDSARLAADFLRQAKVAVTPGIDFGSDAEGHLRFAYTVSIDKIEEGIRRLQRYLRGL